MRLTEQVHLELNKSLRAGDNAIDATAGNGHDTLAIAKLVGASGKVYAIDRQADAIGATRRRLEAAGQLAQCALVEGDHADILNELLGEQHEHVAAITFNLGYLPGGDKELTTLPDTTLRALDAAACLLRPEGVLLVTAYRGHTGGKDEAIQVETWMRTLDESDWRTETEEPPTRDPARVPPILWIARKKNSPEKRLEIFARSTLKRPSETTKSDGGMKPGLKSVSSNTWIVARLIDFFHAVLSSQPNTRFLSP